jgi:hypothetical protein
VRAYGARRRPKKSPVHRRESATAVGFYSFGAPSDGFFLVSALPLQGTSRAPHVVWSACNRRRARPRLRKIDTPHGPIPCHSERIAAPGRELQGGVEILQVCGFQATEARVSFCPTGRLSTARSSCMSRWLPRSAPWGWCRWRSTGTNCRTRTRNRPLAVIAHQIAAAKVVPVRASRIPGLCAHHRTTESRLGLCGHARGDEAGGQSTHMQHAGS